MPRSLAVVHSNVYEGNDVFLTNRIVMADNTQLVQADITGNISVAVYDMSDAGQGRLQNVAIFSKTDIGPTDGGPNGNASVYDAYETLYWDGKDATGYNFLYQLQYDATGTVGPYMRGGHTYRVEFVIRADAQLDFGIVRWAHVLHVLPSKAV